MKTLKLTVAQVRQAISDAELKPREYSGRGMCGAHCLGVDVPKSRMICAAVEIALALVDNGADPEDVKELGRYVDFDQMGLGMVLYWPALRLTDDEVNAFMDEDDAEAHDE